VDVGGDGGEIAELADDLSDGVYVLLDAGDTASQGVDLGEEVIPRGLKRADPGEVAGRLRDRHTADGQRGRAIAYVVNRARSQGANHKQS